ncbi:uncharacterized protein BDW70DRAFT_138337 [Aspergillus foveolatus]|uniref:uncharacterized protein n=1 Tax=Aspergillus foveolatus TaxID=210207 RepID=UPI003CCE0955
MPGHINSTSHGKRYVALPSRQTYVPVMPRAAFTGASGINALVLLKTCRFIYRAKWFEEDSDSRQDNRRHAYECVHSRFGSATYIY